MNLKMVFAGGTPASGVRKTAHTCREETVRERNGEGDMGRTLLISGPSCRGVKGESKSAFACEALRFQQRRNCAFSCDAFRSG